VNRRGETAAAVPGELRIEAADTALLFRFKDDIVVRELPCGNGSRVGVRSLSRIGRNDSGINADRRRKFLRQLAVAYVLFT
jgi:uncharacterized protein (DUF1499 family)